MKKEEVIRLVSELQKKANQEILDEFHKISIGLRESTTPSFSSIMKGFSNRLENMEKKLDLQIEQTKPAVDIIGASKVFATAFKWFAGLSLAVGGTIIAVKQLLRSLL